MTLSALLQLTHKMRSLLDMKGVIIPHEMVIALARARSHQAFGHNSVASEIRVITRHDLTHHVTVANMWGTISPRMIVE